MNNIYKSFTKVIFFGDSICNGQYVSLNKQWVTRIAETLSKVNETIIVTNSSIDGRTTRQALEDMTYRVQKHKAEILYIQFGLNDCNYWLTDNGVSRVNIESFKYNLIEMIERGLNFGSKIIFLATNHVTLLNSKLSYASNNSIELNNNKYNKIIRSVANKFKKKIILIDHEKIFLKEINLKNKKLKDLLLKDKIHLSEEGHDLYYQTVSNVMLGVDSKL